MINKQKRFERNYKFYKQNHRIKINSQQSKNKKNFQAKLKVFYPMSSKNLSNPSKPSPHSQTKNKEKKHQQELKRKNKQKKSSQMQKHFQRTQGSELIDWVVSELFLIKLETNKVHNYESLRFLIDILIDIIKQLEIINQTEQRMGNANLNKNSYDFNGQLIPNKQQLEILYQCEQGEVAESLTNSKQYFIRQLAFPNSQQLQKSLHKLQKVKESIHQPSMLTNLLQIQTIHIKSMCSSQHRLRLVFQYSKFSLNDEIQARMQLDKYLDYVDTCRIIIGCVRALAEVQELIGQNGQLFNTGVCHRVFINPQRILVMDEGQIKIISPLIISPYDRFQHRNNSYYSPQKLSDFDYNEDQKSCLFELGLTLLHILTLKNCRDVYNGFQVKQDEIDKKIHQIWQLYSDSLICQILCKLTRTFRPIRANLQQAISMSKHLQDKLMQVLYQPKNNPMRISLQKINSHYEQQQMISQIQLTTETVQSEEEQQIFEQQIRKLSIQDKISESRYHTKRINVKNQIYTKRQTKQNSSLKYSRSVLKQIQVSPHQEDDINEIKNTTSQRLGLYRQISYRGKQNYQAQNMDIKIVDHIHNKKSDRGEQINRNIKQQSCVITNESPFYNLAFMNTQHQHNNSAYLSFLKPNNGKQSYQYGNQLAEGIISLSMRKDIKIKQNLKTEQEQISIKQRSEMEQEGTDQSRKLKKSKWQRTQFNKKKQKRNQLQVRLNRFQQYNKYSMQNINRISSRIEKNPQWSNDQVNKLEMYQ